MRTKPKFHILDIVEVTPADSQKFRATVLQVREYPDGRFKYSVGPLLEGEIDLGGIYNEKELSFTGVRSDPKSFTTFGSFHIRDKVLIAENCSLPEFAGEHGVVMGRPGGPLGPESELLVWIDNHRMVAVLDPAELTPTGERETPSAVGSRTSSQVSSTGELLGEVSYVVLEDIGEL